MYTHADGRILASMTSDVASLAVQSAKRAAATVPQGRPMAELSNYQIAHDILKRRIASLEALRDDDGRLEDEDTAELRRAYVLLERVARASVDAVAGALETAAL